LGGDRPIYGLQAVGVEGEATPQTEVAEMAAHYRQEIQRHQPTGPYLVCGWSSGGILAFEVARQLEADGEQVGLLALFDAGVQGDREFTTEDFLPMLLTMFPGEDEAEIQALQDEGPEAQLAWFQRRAELAQLVVAGAAATQAQYVFEVFQANINAIAQYQPQPYEGRITLFRASEHATPMHADPKLGWGRWASGGVDVFEVPGNHVTMFREPTIAELAAQLERCLGEI
jgi:thioesterase domain-containing protein